MMMITKEAAMKQLLEAKERAAREPGFHSGYFLGLASAYWRARVITYEQYLQLTEPESAAA